MVLIFLFQILNCHAEEVSSLQIKTQKIVEAYKKNQTKFHSKTLNDLSKNKNHKLSIKAKKALDQELDDLDRALSDIEKALNPK